MNKRKEKHKTAIAQAEEKKRILTAREKKLFRLLIGAMIVSAIIGLLSGRHELGGWEVIIPLVTISNYIIYYFWSDSQVKKYEAEHLTLGYYANDRKQIPTEQLSRYQQLKFEYILDVLKNTALVALLCGGLVIAGRQLATGSLTGLWILAVVALSLGIAKIMHNQKHQINRFGKNGNSIMSR